MLSKILKITILLPLMGKGKQAFPWLKVIFFLFFLNVICKTEGNQSKIEGKIVHMYIFLIKGTLGLHIHSAHFSNFDLAIFVIHRIDSFLWLFLLEFFYSRTVRSHREREWWTLYRPAALHPGMSVQHRDLFPYRSVWDLWHFGADPYLWLMDPDPTLF